MAETETRSRHLKPWPKFRSDAEADEWLQKADLTQYDLETANVPFKAWWAAMVPGDTPARSATKAMPVKAVKVKIERAKPPEVKVAKAEFPKVKIAKARAAKAAKARKAKSVPTGRHRARA